MDGGIPTGLSWYRLLQDQGSMLGGILALAAGGFAYLAGVLQARATRESAAKQISALDAQLEQIRATTAEDDRRHRQDLLRSLAMEASRVKMVAETKYSIAQKRHNNAVNPGVMPESAKIFMISTSPAVRDTRHMTALLPHDLQMAADGLFASVDQLNTLLEVKASAIDLTGSELMNALLKVGGRADGLMAALGSVPAADWR